MLIALLEHRDLPRRDLSSVVRSCSGGATVPPELVRASRRARRRASASSTAQTEASPVDHARPPRRRAGGQGETIGRPLPQTEVKIVDPATGEVVPPGDRRRAVHARLPRHDGILRRPGGDRRGDRCRRLAAHRRPRLDGRARLLPHRRPPEGHDHPRRREHLPARDRAGAASPTRRWPTSRSSASPTRDGRAGGRVRPRRR